jgi:hypothetical protein
MLVVGRAQFEDLIARAFDGAIIVDGLRVVAHRSGTHVVRGGPPRVTVTGAPRPRAWDRDNDWSDV